MAWYRTKNVEIEAEEFMIERVEELGMDVYHPPVLPWICNNCGFGADHHGWVETLEGGDIACEGDFIITGLEGEKYPCKPSIFHKKYEKVG